MAKLLPKRPLLAAAFLLSATVSSQAAILTITFDFTSAQPDAAFFTYDGGSGLQLTVTPGQLSVAIGA